MHCLGVDVIDRYRKCDRVGATNEHVIAGAHHYLNPHISGRYNQLAKIIPQHIAITCKLLDGNIPLYIDKSQNWCWNQLT
jgi:hypothetical protein